MQYQPRHFRDLPAPERVDRSQQVLTFPASQRAIEVAAGVYWFAAGSCAGWVTTPEGVALIDSGLNRPVVAEELRRTAGDAPVRYVVYTHGHEDHVLLMQRYQEIAPGAQVIAHAFVPERLRKYEELRPFITRVNTLQFHLPLRTDIERAYKEPDVTYWDRHAFALGGRRFELFHGRGETDDATVVHLPDEGVVFAGDFLISALPNLGNPYKVPRYPRGWIEALERVLALRPRVVLPGHGRQLLQGDEIEAGLGDAVRGLRFLHDEVVRRLNEGQTLDRMVAEIRLPPDLEDSPHLRQTYSRVEFAVIAIHRAYAGWFDGDPSDLFPLPRRALARELRQLIGDDARILARAQALWSEGRRQEAVELAQLVLRDAPDHAQARRLRLRFMEELLAEDRCVMSRGAWHYFADQDRAFLAEQDAHKEPE